MKLLTPVDGYPEKYWFTYDHENSLDHLEFVSCKEIELPTKRPRMFLSEKVSVNAIRKYDYLFSDGPDFVSARVAEIIARENLSKDIQLVPIDVVVNDELYDDYFIVNYLKQRKAFCMAECIYRPLIRSMPDGPKKFNKIVLLDIVPVDFIFRSLESISHVVASDEFVRLFKENDIKGVDFVEGKSSL